MALDLYTPCPCGSGKKFKWCCQPIHSQIEKAFRQEQEGQHETAIRLMDEMTREHSANPEAWGRKAQLLFQNDRPEEAEQALQKAFEINPNYPFGHYLKGKFREFEGESAGALLLYRKAAELYDPEAKDTLGVLYSSIAESELKLHRPVAARAALHLAIRCQPADQELRDAFESVFGEKSRLPLAARREYAFQSPADGVQSQRRENWNRALGDGVRTRLSEAVQAFSQLTQENQEDAAAWYNLGLAQAWMGDNRAALASLDRYVALEPDETKAAAAWALGEVLRTGDGMEEEANVTEYSTLYQVRDLGPVAQILEQWQQERRLIPISANQEQGIITGMLLEKPPALTPDLAATQLVTLESYFLLMGDRLRLWHTDVAALNRIREEVQQRLGPSVQELGRDQKAARFDNFFAETLAFPLRGEDNKAQAERLVLEFIQRFFEDKWIHRPLRSLNMISPVDAAGQGALRKKLAGVVQFLDECAKGRILFPYDFNGLRRKLGLLGGEAAATGPDIRSMGVKELAALATDQLPDDQLEEAFQAAQKLDARDLSGNFARTLIARPPRPERADRFSFYAHLAQQAQVEGDTAAALEYLQEGGRRDQEHNQGRRCNEFDLRRGQIHVKRGEMEEAKGVFEGIIARAPLELRYRGAAAEAMLSANRKPEALHFAETGLAKAREKQDRDSESYFMELVSAAKK